MSLSLRVVLCFFLSLSACQKMQPEKVNFKSKPTMNVIYGEDNRIDFYSIEDAHWRQMAESTVALFDHRKLSLSSDRQSYHIDSEIYGQNFHLCEDEVFYEQPTASFCSGFLIGPEMIVTAGHCVRNQYNCENVRFAFGYHYSKEAVPPTEIPADQVYGCSEVIHTETNALTGVDFAILKTDRPVLNFQSLPLRSRGQLERGDKLTVIGYPSGLPGKYAEGGDVRDNSKPGYVVTSLDTYGGNSGSAVFNSATRLIEGILVRGDKDFIYDQEARCRRSHVCLENECRGEDVVRIELIYDHITPKDLMPLSTKNQVTNL